MTTFTRSFQNPHELSIAVLSSRIHNLDPMAQIVADTRPIVDPADSVTITGIEYFVLIHSETLTDEQINAALATPQTQEESANLQAYTDAVNNFNNLPNWATWTAADFQQWTDTNLMTDAQIDAAAGLSAALKQNLKAQNAFIRNGGKAILFLRDYIIRMRRA